MNDGPVVQTIFLPTGSDVAQWIQPAGWGKLKMNDVTAAVVSYVLWSHPPKE